MISERCRCRKHSGRLTVHLLVPLPAGPGRVTSSLWRRGRSLHRLREQGTIPRAPAIPAFCSFQKLWWKKTIFYITYSDCRNSNYFILVRGYYVLVSQHWGIWLCQGKPMSLLPRGASRRKHYSPKKAATSEETKDRSGKWGLFQIIQLYISLTGTSTFVQEKVVWGSYKRVLSFSSLDSTVDAHCVAAAFFCPL